MPQKQFLPFLTDQDGRSLTVENGTVVTRAIPAHQNLSPEGWENSVVQFARNNEFRGLFKSYTTPLKFFLDSARILREYYYRFGLEAIVFFIWLKLDQSFGGEMTYRGWYKGEPDFSTFKDGWDNVQINITEGGFYKDLAANKDIVYEIPVVDDDTIWLYMDGIVVKQELQYEDTPGVEVSILFYGDDFFGPAVLVGKDGNSTNVLSQTENLESIPSPTADRFTNDNIIMRNLNKDPLNIVITGLLEFTCTGMTSSPAYALRHSFLTSTQTTANQTLYEIFDTGLVVGTTYSHPFTMPITLLPGEALLREGRFYGGPGTDAKIEYTENSKFTINFDTRKDATVVPTQTMYNLGNKVVKKMSKNISSLDSPFLQADLNLLLAPGDALRGISGAVIKTKFSDYHKSVDAVKCIALEVVENNPSIKSRYDKFNNTTIAALGECRGWTLTPAVEYMYDSIEVGYPKKDPLGTDNVNGRLSFNNTFIWKTPLSRVKNTYKAISVYLSDPYVIESFRINFDKKTTTDSTSDNDVFWLDGEPKTDISFGGATYFYTAGNEIKLVGGDVEDIFKFITPGIKLNITGSASNDGIFTVVQVTASNFPAEVTFEVLELINTTEVALPGIVTPLNIYKLRRLPYTTINGVPNGADLFNIELSPKRILANHYRWIKSGIEHKDSEKITFQSTDKNADLETIDAAGVTITEKADIPLANMGDRVFLPHYYEFEVESPYNLVDLMKANNSGHFDYKMEGFPLEGFPIDIKTNEATLESQQYKLLATANIDLTPLITR